MTTIIIPAHNEESVIARCLTSLIADARPGELEVIVVCNGCRDRTAEVARAIHPAIKVIETDIPSKVNALNLGDQAASGFPRLYLDADVEMTTQSARALTAALEQNGVFAAAPVADTIFLKTTSTLVRAYYRFWMALPYMREGMMAAGAYAVSEEGRKRFGVFPDIISDDGYFRLQFRAGERIEVPTAKSRVVAPTTVRDLIRIRTRSRVGQMQIAQRFPELFNREQATKQYGNAAMAILGKPTLYWAAAPYLWITLLSRMRARKQAATLEQYVWERDQSSR